MILTLLLYLILNLMLIQSLHTVFSSVQFSRSVMSDSLWPHGLQHARLPYPSPIPWAFSNSCLLSWWFHPTTSSSVVPFYSHLQSFPALGSFPKESVLCIKYWSFSFSISPSSEYSGLFSFRIDWLDLLTVQETLKRVLQHHSSKASILRCSAFFIVQLSCRERINNRVLLNSTEKYIQSPERNHNGKEEQKRMCVYNWVT